MLARVPTTAAVGELISEEYAALVPGGRIEWAHRWRVGVVVRCDLRGGGTSTGVWRRDEDVGREWAEVLGVEAFVGDRRECGGVSAR